MHNNKLSNELNVLNELEKESMDLTWLSWKAAEMCKVVRRNERNNNLKNKIESSSSFNEEKRND